MPHRHIILTTIIGLLFGTAALAHDTRAPLTESRKQFLAGYEVVRAALANDDLEAARKAAAAISDNEHAERLAKAGTIAEARDAFKKLSARAVHLVVHQDGFFIAHCPMVKDGGGDWVQLTETVSNPYFGKSMLRCGSIKATSNSAPDEDAK